MIKKGYVFFYPFIMQRIKNKVINIDVYGGLSFTINLTKGAVGDEIIVTQPLTFGIGISKTF